MFFFRYLLYPVVLSSLLLFYWPTTASADDVRDETISAGYKWFLTLFGGPSAQPDLENVFKLNMRFEDDTYIVVAALARQFWRFKNWISSEVEGQTGKYFGDEHQWQFNGLIIGRWHWFPWDEYLDTSIAVGNGLSFNTETSKVEKEDDEEAGQWLNYLMCELTVGLPKYPRWNFAYRIHHRSSIRGLIGNGASNFVTFGIKYGF